MPNNPAIYVNGNTLLIGIEYLPIAATPIT
jgi:hypothetical protein